MPKNSNNSSGRNWLSYVNFGLLAIVAILLLTQMAQVYKFRNRIAFIDDLEQMNVEALKEVDTAKGHLLSFGTDLNEIREFLLLPTREYRFDDLGDVELVMDEEESLTVELFTLVEQISAFDENQAAWEAAQEELNALAASELWASRGLTANFQEDVLFVYHSDYLNSELLRVEVDFEGEMDVVTYDGQYWGVDELETQLSEEWVSAYVSGVERLTVFRDYWEKEFFVDPEFTKITDSLGLEVSSANVSDQEISYDVTNADGVTVLEFILSFQDMKAFVFMGLDQMDEGNPFLEIEEPEFTYDEFTFALGDVDVRTSVQLEVDAFAQEMRDLMQDEGFESTLNRLGLRMEGPEVTDERISYTLYREEEALRVIFVDKSTGKVFVGLPGEEAAESLSEANANLLLALEGKKKRWNCLA